MVSIFLIEGLKGVKSAYKPSGPSGQSLTWFLLYEATRSISTPPLDGMLVHRRVTPSSKFASTHLYTWVKRDTVRVKCLVQEHNAVRWPKRESGSLDPPPNFW